MTFQLEEFEHMAYSRQYEQAARMLVNLLTILDKSYGVPGEQYQAMPLLAVVPGQREAHVGNRLAAAISCLFSDKEFHFAPQSQVSLFALQRWFAIPNRAGEAKRQMAAGVENRGCHGFAVLPG